jgi:GTPase SAR1 family protein
MITAANSLGSVVDLEIWDTPGQPAFNEVAASAFTKTDVALICFEHNEKDKTEEEETIKKWIDKVKIRAPNCTTILVLTKADLLDTAVVEDLKMTRDEFVKQYGAKFLAITSAKNDWDVTSLLARIADCPNVPMEELLLDGYPPQRPPEPCNC